MEIDTRKLTTNIFKNVSPACIVKEVFPKRTSIPINPNPIADAVIAAVWRLLMTS
jgi:hypothetical protein